MYVECEAEYTLVSSNSDGNELPALVLHTYSIRFWSSVLGTVTRFSLYAMGMASTKERTSPNYCP